jgi:hypothetical protein
MLGILDAGQSVATGVLQQLVDLNELREAIERVIGSEGYGRHTHVGRNEIDEPHSEKSVVPLLRGDERQQGVIDWVRQPRSMPDSLFRARLEWSGEPIDVSANDMFEALVKIREQLELHGWFVAVQGARVDTFPTMLQREATGGMNVHVIHMGTPARSRDVVETLAEADPSKLATVAAQRAFADEWLRSVQQNVDSER